MLSEDVLNQRLQQLKKWLNDHEPYQKIEQIAGDASFRRYFRVYYADKTLIAMDAPPELEDSHAFVAISKVYEQKGLRVPHVLSVDLPMGFMLITDLNDDLYFRILTEDNADRLYHRAIEKLHVIQTCSQKNGYTFPVFGYELLMEELMNFQKWYLETHLGLPLTKEEKQSLFDIFTLLVSSAESQPQVCVHRDYHSRNLLALPEGEVGILDFQDAVWGPVTYDLASLIRDCYIDWPDEWVEKWMQQYYANAVQFGLCEKVSLKQFKQWFDWMGIQRHLKAIFIFARKWHRDQNKDYLGDIPRALKYVIDVSDAYPQLADFRRFLMNLE